MALFIAYNTLKKTFFLKSLWEKLIETNTAEKVGTNALYFMFFFFLNGFFASQHGNQQLTIVFVSLLNIHFRWLI